MIDALRLIGYWVSGGFVGLGVLMMLVCVFEVKYWTVAGIKTFLKGLWVIIPPIVLYLVTIYFWPIGNIGLAVLEHILFAVWVFVRVSKYCSDNL